MADLTEQEQQYFESGGTTEFPAEEPVAEAAPTEQVTGEGQVEVTEQPAQPAEEPGHAPDSMEVKYEKVQKAVAEARAETRIARQQLKQLYDQQAQWAQRVHEMQQRMGVPEATGPTMDSDPAGYLQQQVEQVNRKLAEIQQREQAQQQVAQVTNWYANQAAQFKASQPDFDAAYAHHNQARVSQLIEAGLSPEQAGARLQQEEMQLAIFAAQSGRNPAQMVYGMAVANGYRPGAKEAPKPAQPATPAAAQKLEQIQRGVEAAKSMSTAGGGGGGRDNLTWESVLEHRNGADFLRDWDRMVKREGLH